jgi:Ca2+-binding EF-hand superfamily protein
MKSKILLLVVAGTVALTAAQSAIPKFKRPTRSSFNELVAYNLPGYTPQQLWSFRNVEHNVKFDSGLNCYYEAWKSNGIEQKYDSYCWNKEVHWTVDGNSCMQGSKSVSITSTVNSFWTAYDQFTKYEGIVSDPYYASGQTFHRMKHSTQNRWIWFRTSDLAIVYEQYYDGTQASFVKLFEGGIKENAYLFTSDFRIPKCSNPFLASMTSFVVSPDAAFSLAANSTYNYTYGYNSTSEAVPMNPADYNTKPVRPHVERPSQAEIQLQKYAKWILTNYDANKDGQLDKAEAQKLWNDVVSYDYSGEIVAQVTQAQNWFGQFDTNRDGKISFGELAKALNTELGGVTSFASVKKVDPAEQKLQELADWIMTNYDVNKDQTLDDSEAQKLWRDIQSYDYAGIVVGDVAQAKQWIAKFDTNKDGKITVGELYNALKSETGAVSFANIPSKRVEKVDEFEQQVQQVANWIMTNYDTNKDQTLDNFEAQKLWNDVQSYDYAGIVAADVAQVKAWIAKFDTNKNGKITVGELVKAIKAEGPISFASRPVYFNSTTNSTNSTNSTSHHVRPVKVESDEEKKLKQYAKWVLDNYDTNKDGQLDEAEGNKLWNDISTYDYSGELIAQVGQVQAWISKFDTNKNGKLTIGELYIALSRFV